MPGLGRVRFKAAWESCRQAGGVETASHNNGGEEQHRRAAKVAGKVWRRWRAGVCHSGMPHRHGMARKAGRWGRGKKSGGGHRHGGGVMGHSCCHSWQKVLGMLAAAAKQSQVAQC